MIKIAAILLWIPMLIWVAAEYVFRLIWPPEPAAFDAGVTFSASQAEALGLDWEETFLALLSDMGVKRFRIPAYWTEIEPESGFYDFSRLDRIISEIENRNTKAIIAIGIKLPRWPECHIPDFAQELLNSASEILNSEFENKLLEYIRAVVERYKNSPAIEMWQIENEPFFRFGECPKIPAKLLEKEIALVKSLDSRPIMITDSGELGTWIGAARFGDVLGVSVYRITWRKGFGYLRYPLPAGFYEKKASIIKSLFGDPVEIIEMQLEPWAPSIPLSNVSIDEQFKSMNLDKFKKNIAYAKASRLSPVYFWGAEWWYWMRLNGYPEFWIYARDNIFQTR